MREEICFITSKDHGFLISKLRNLFEAAEIEVCMCSDDVAEIKKNRQEIDIFVYYSDAGYARADSTMAYLSGLCFDEHKSLCLIGEESFLNKALASDSYGSVRYRWIRIRWCRISRICFWCMPSWTGASS